MAANRRVNISLDERYLAELSVFARMDGRRRNDLLNEALKAYLEERRKMLRHEEMEKGYQEMAAINLKLAEEEL